MLVNVNCILLKKGNKEHLMYILDKLLINVNYTGLHFYLVDFETLSKCENILDGYKIVDNVIVQVENEKLNNYMKLHFYNCISMGKILTGFKGIFFNCHSFINKLKEQYGK